MSDKTPPIETSPVFQQRTAEALGGAPSSPTQFQKIEKASPSDSPAAPQPQSRRTHTTFDVDPKAEAMRTKINTARAKLSSTITSIDELVHSVGSLVEELESSKEGKEEAARQGFDLDVAKKFLTDLSKAVDAVKPKK